MVISAAVRPIAFLSQYSRYPVVPKVTTMPSSAPKKLVDKSAHHCFVKKKRVFFGFMVIFVRIAPRRDIPFGMSKLTEKHPISAGRAEKRLPICHLVVSCCPRQQGRHAYNTVNQNIMTKSHNNATNWDSGFLGKDCFPPYICK